MFCCSHRPLRTCLPALVVAASALGADMGAQAPGSIGGRTLEFVIASGSGRLAAGGTYRFLPSALNAAYAIVPVAGDLVGMYGNYHYQTTDLSTAILSYISGQFGPEYVVTCTFTGPEAGTYVLENPNAPDDRQTGAFIVFSACVPLSIVGSTITLEITGRVGDYNESGSAYFLPGPDGTFRIIGIKGVGDHTGQYSYEVSSPTTAIIRVYDEVTGTTQCQQLSFKDAGFGTYLIQADSTPGFQTGTFTYSPPLTLSSPRLVGNQLQFTFAAEANRSYRIESTSTLDPAFWRSIAQFPPASGATNILITDPVGPGPQFYRALAR